MTARHRIGSIAACAGAAILACGCTPGPASSATAQYSIGRAYLLGDAGRQAHEWRQTWAVDCMADAGFDYRREPYDDQSVVAVGAGASLESREQFGYGISMDPPAPAGEVDNHVAIDPDELDAFRAVLGDCLTSADEEVERRRAELGDAISEADQRFIEEAFSGGNDRVSRALEEWANCMNGRGWDFARPEDVQGSLEEDRSRLNNGSPSNDVVTEFRDRERAIAVADFECSQGTVRAAERDFFDELDQRLANYDIDIYS